MSAIRLALAACVMISAASTSAQQPKIDNAKVAERLHQFAADDQLRQSEPDLTLKAIKSAGLHRVVQAIPDLVELLGFRYWYAWEREKRLRGDAGGRYLITSATRYPATEALAEIGKPALPALLEVIETHKFASIESKNARSTIRDIFRDDQRADEYFKSEAASAGSAEAKQRLLKAIQTADQDRRLSPEDRRPPATSP